MPGVARCGETDSPQAMTMTTEIPPDQLAALVPSDGQRQAARMAQDAFAALFRLTLEADPERLDTALAEIDTRCERWCQAGASPQAQSLRRALLIGGLDQWGLAYNQAFGLSAIPALSRLLGSLRNRPDARADALFQTYFSQIETVESDAVEFKIELRRNIHLALWHAMTAGDDRAEAERIMQALGGLMLVLARRMPALGWRLLADTLATIQIRLLDDSGAVDGLGQEMTQQLFSALRRNLPLAQYQAILAYAGQAVVGWQQSRRPTH